MNRRRMMMLQQAGKGFELVYDAASGVLPTAAANGWRKFGNPWNNQFGYGTQKIVDNVLVLHNGHSYEKQGYYPIEHEYANNCEIGVTFSNATTDVAIHLTDGTKSAMGTVNNSMFYVRTYVSTQNFIQCSKAITLREVNTFVVQKKGNKATYFLNGELLYTQTELFDINQIYTGTAGNATDENPTGFFTESINGWSYGMGGSDLSILSFYYKEW